MANTAGGASGNLFAAIMRATRAEAMLELIMGHQKSRRNDAGKKP
jgi:hypothetical protein